MVKNHYPLRIKKFIRTILQLFFIIFSVQNCSCQSFFENQYDEIKQINKDIYIVRTDSLWGIVDKANSIKIPVEQKSIYLDHKVHNIIFEHKNGKFGVSDVLCKRITEAVYDSINVFRITDGKHYLKCWKSGVSSIFDQHKGFLFTNNCKDFIKVPFENNLFLVKNKINTWGLVNSQSTLQIPFKYDTLILQYNKTINYKTPNEEKFFFAAKINDKYGLIDYNDKIILGFEYEEIEVLNQNHFIVRKNQNFGSVDNKGKSIIPLKYKVMELFGTSDGQGPYLKVINENNLAGIFNKFGEVIIPEKYLPDSFESSDPKLAYSIEASDSTNHYFFTTFNDFQPVPFIEKESIGGNQVNGVFIYTLKNHQKCIVGGDPRKLCKNAFEYFDEFERIWKNEKEFIILKKRDVHGNFKFGIREVWWGKCMASIIFDELEFNITEKQIKYFKPQKNERILAVGFIKKDNSKWIISNFGVKKIK